MTERHATVPSYVAAKFISVVHDNEALRDHLRTGRNSKTYGTCSGRIHATIMPGPWCLR